MASFRDIRYTIILIFIGTKEVQYTGKLGLMHSSTRTIRSMATLPEQDLNTTMMIALLIS